MSATTGSITDAEEPIGNWVGGVIGGCVGAVVMGVFVLLMNPPTLAVAIPSLYGAAPPANPTGGLVIHISHGAVLGVVFADLVRTASPDSIGTILALSVVFGVATWVVLAALLMPVWLSAVGSPASPPFPNFAPPSLPWHGVYGLVLGGTYAWTDDSF